MNHAEQTIPTLAFVACIESGELEHQALLLFESIRRYGGRFADAPVHAVSPRRARMPSAWALDRMTELQVQHHSIELNRDCAEYGSANRVAAAGFIEAQTDRDILVVLDSDTLFLQEPSDLALPSDVDVALRPVDVKGMCSAGPQDPADAYWQALCRVADFPIDSLPMTTSSVDQVRVRASYNGGLVVCRTRLGILQRWNELFFLAARRGLQPRPHAGGMRAGAGPVAPAAARWWGSNQAALAIAAWSTSRRIVELDAGYNYPLHLHDRLLERGRALPMQSLVHAHYHWLLSAQDRSDCRLLAPDGLDPDCRQWLVDAIQRCWPTAVEQGLALAG